mmetsp:Transcript_6152/g.6345  ORF Transcript_6152/g.6345 Transcript_6152/m.6345 type:complete len:281 (+) Transcript_6152:96-938(+)|eukprot:CAMPEP_0182420558 /NCGR_PEP_ID=MMETSP1167-20130531/5444_1 /TAXON_ID=2988 /ORGANISM="Mallomonas Sp, Strain CCMP3275" /LENGTH=280 /DNA_ID=CAMNT_0024596663 /DNA_START=38 /DNA_END=880 /DNA_ORIENTATION=+
MGICNSSSSRVNNGDNSNQNAVGKIQMLLRQETNIPMEVCVAHFTPSSFPLIPLINMASTRLCRESWDLIMNRECVDDSGAATSGMTMFYNEFYERLEVFDSSGKFEAVLSRHSSGTNRIAAKGAILIRIIKFVVKIEEDNKQTQLLLYMLGKSHSQKNIRPWQYSVFVQTLLITISSRLGTDATTDVMAAWVNLFAFVMKSMLPPSIAGQIVETELNINTSSEFSAGKVADEVKVLEEQRQFAKNFNNKTDSSSVGANSARPQIQSARSQSGGNRLQGT